MATRRNQAVRGRHNPKFLTISVKLIIAWSRWERSRKRRRRRLRPFAIYNSPHGRGFVLIHLPSQVKILDLTMQNACKHAVERFAALDLNWWPCIPEEVIGPDLQEMWNIHLRLKPTPWIASDWGRGDR